MGGGFVFAGAHILLCAFNLLPIPPLDGSSILVLFLKGRALDRYYEVQRYAMPILIVVLYVLPTVFGIDFLGMYFDVTCSPSTGCSSASPSDGSALQSTGRQHGRRRGGEAPCRTA